eukprot:2798205-Rhodomonas_salina.1
MGPVGSKGEVGAVGAKGDRGDVGNTAVRLSVSDCASLCAWQDLWDLRAVSYTHLRAHETEADL